MSEVDQNQQEQTTEPQYTEIEQKAMSMGWKPQDDYSGDAEWVSAEMWVARAPLFDKIEQQGRVIKNLQRAQEDFKKLHEKRMQTEYQRALKEMQQQKRDAIKEGDFELAADLDEKIDEHKSQAPVPEQAPANNEDAAFVNAWKGKNSWYDNDPELQEDFDGYFLSKINRGADVKEAIQYAENRLRKQNPDKFGERKPVSKVEDGTKGTARTKPRESDIELTEDELRVGKNFERSGVMTLKEYKEEIRKLRQQGV